MKWVVPAGYKKEQIDWAGNILVSNKPSKEDFDKAFDILDNWRAIHGYPMHALKNRIDRYLSIMDPEGFGAQRLKRFFAIYYKLDRSKRGILRKLTLFQMQDLGGCRAILSNVNFVKPFCDKCFLKAKTKHKLITNHDYIAKPRPSGYRGVHLVYQYFSDKPGKKEYSGLLIEIQIRSKLQHLWATADETIGIFIDESIKSSEAKPEWLEFFKLVSSAFALMEKCPLVENTPQDEKELYLMIKQKEAELEVIKKLKSWKRGIHETQELKKKGKFQYYLLELNIPKEELSVTPFTEAERIKAIEKYAEIEKRNLNKKEYNVVLVSADKTSDLQKTYTNYYGDTDEFVKVLTEIINKY
ncbi:MAG: RelA/SpoT domain-containing protein [Nanoarchaeota archaeon]